MDWHPIQGGVKNTLSRFVPQKPGYALALMGHLASKQALLLLLRSGVQESS